MRILFLGASDSPVMQWLISRDEIVYQTMDKISCQDLSEKRIDFVISYGYRYIIKKDILNMLPNCVINMHISFLPWNRGTDPNLWSFIEGTPKGVSIHYVDEGIDTGDLIAQKEVDLHSEHTLRSSYDLLQDNIQELFYQKWDDIKHNRAPRRKQIGVGTFHKRKDKEILKDQLKKGWDTPVSELVNLKLLNN